MRIAHILGGYFDTSAKKSLFQDKYFINNIKNKTNKTKNCTPVPETGVQ